MIITQTFTGAFICWNLFLAILPLYFSYTALRASTNIKSWILMAFWLLFSPNAAYLVTDIVHLDTRDNTIWWLDLILLVSAAINGLLYSMFSLNNIEQLLKKNWHIRHVNMAIFFLSGLCGYGIYLGRRLRWNSWDIITTPFALFGDISDHIIRPVYHKQVWFMTLLFAVWLYILYMLFAKYMHRSK